MAGHSTYQVNVIKLRACLHGGGGPQVGEVTCGASPHLSCKRDQIKTSDSMDRRVTPPKRVSKQALNRTTAANATFLLSQIKSSKSQHYSMLSNTITAKDKGS